MSNTRVRHFEVDANFVGWRLDQFLANRLGRISRTKAARIAKHGDVSITPDRGAVKPALKLKLGDVVTLKEHLPDEQIQDDEVRILYEDEVLLILNKPPGMLVHESVSIRLNTIQGYLARAGFEEAEAVHRLDKETSGVLVCAKTRAYVPVLRKLFATTHPDKVYRAIVLDKRNRWHPGQKTTLNWPLGLMDSERLKLRMGHGMLNCTTHVETLRRGQLQTFGTVSDLLVTIETGRQHQIRVHLNMAGTPIAGDKLYGQTDDFFIQSCDNPTAPEILQQLPFARHALHAWRLTMPHPRSPHREMCFEAPLPKFWQFDGQVQWFDLARSPETPLQRMNRRAPKGPEKL